MKSVLTAAIVLVSVVCFAEGFQVGDRITDFKLPTVDGKTVSTAGLREGRPVVLKFGSTWCGWCNRQVPHLNKVAEKYAKQVAIIDIDIKEDAAKVRRHNKEMKAKYITLLDKDGIVAQKYEVRGIPVVIVADADGKILYRGNYTEFEKLEDVLDPAVKAAMEAKKNTVKEESHEVKPAVEKE